MVPRASRWVLYRDVVGMSLQDTEVEAAGRRSNEHAKALCGTLFVEYSDTPVDCVLHFRILSVNLH